MTQFSSDTDLAYLRSMAEAGERAPLLGGRFSLWWGGLASIALTAHWMIETQILNYPPDSAGLIWLIFGVVGSLGSIALGLTMKNKRGTGSAGNRVQNAVWTASIFAIFAFAIGASLAYGLGRVPKLVFEIIPLMAFSIYAVNFYAVATMSGTKWLYGFSALSCAAVVLGWLALTTPHFYLLCAGATFGLAILPGLIHLSVERTSAAPASA